MPTDKSIKGDVSSLRYDFEIVVIDKIIWVPGKFNLADPLTKRDSPLIRSLQTKTSSGFMSTDMIKCLVSESKKTMG